MEKWVGVNPEIGAISVGMRNDENVFKRLLKGPHIKQMNACAYTDSE